MPTTSPDCAEAPPAAETAGLAAGLATTGIEWRTRPGPLAEAVEVLSSMRFSISLLTVICIASVIGTVVRQHEPAIDYVNRFGPFWSEVFTAAGLTAVYSAWWFVLILAFLVVSTCLCIARNLPKIVADLRTYKEHVREQALAAFHLHARGDLAARPDAAYARIAALLAAAGWKAKAERRGARGTMIAARRGTANRLGYLAAHSAIVLICVGGLVDGDLIVRAQMALQGKTAFRGGGLIRDVASGHRLAPSTPTFRASLLVPEGGRAGVAVIQRQDGIVLQELPFDVELKKFVVDYYATGMPKLFASEIVIHDRETGASRAATVKVNEPAFHRGIAIYQSSFDDGGSRLKLRAWPLVPGAAPFDVEGTVGDAGRPLAASAASAGGETLTLELTGLRAINVENLAGDGAAATDVRKVDLVGALERHLGSGAKAPSGEKALRNVGPSVTYKLRDASGQAREFHNYMLPVELDGQRVFLAGVRDAPDAPFRYLRIPADETSGLDGWFRLRGALLDAARRDRAAARYAKQATPVDRPALEPQLAATAKRVLGLFAGSEASSGGGGAGRRGGLQAVSDFLEGGVPESERARVSEVLLRILSGSLFELLNEARGDAGLAPLAPGAEAQAFMTQAVLALSDSFHYPAPVLLALADFRQVQASVFQVARAPGRTLVYAGAVLLIVGVFAMLYVRERRLWIWLEPAAAEGATRVTMALSGTRPTLDTDAEFDRLRRAIFSEAA